MLADPAFFLYLYDYEVEFICNPIKTDKPGAIKFSNASFFIDDECNLNDSGEFSKSFHVISPNELQLKCENYELHILCLDLYISVIDGINEYKLYDKRVDYPFLLFVCQT